MPLKHVQTPNAQEACFQWWQRLPMVRHRCKYYANSIISWKKLASSICLRQRPSKDFMRQLEDFFRKIIRGRRQKLPAAAVGKITTDENAEERPSFASPPFRAWGKSHFDLCEYLLAVDVKPHLMKSLVPTGFYQRQLV